MRDVPLSHEKSSHDEISYVQMIGTARLAAWNVDLEGAQSRRESRRLKTKEFGGTARAINSTFGASKRFQQVGAFAVAPLALGQNRIIRVDGRRTQERHHGARKAGKRKLELESLPFREDDSSFDDVLQFSDVARPFISLQSFTVVPRQAQRRNSMSL